MSTNKRIKILFYNKNKSGVNYFRTLTPAIHLDKHYIDDFDITINSEFDPTSDEGMVYMKSFDIIHYHQYLTNVTPLMVKISEELKNNNTKLILDLDDYWILDNKHPKYYRFKEDNVSQMIETNIKLADYITTTTELLGEEIKKVSGKNNIIILENSIDPETMPQFENNRTKDDVVRIMYLGGSTHFHDIKQLEGVANMLNCDPETKNKYKFINVGWDMRGEKHETMFNQDLKKELEDRKLFTQKLLNEIIKSNTDESKIKSMPEDLKLKYSGRYFNIQKRPWKPNEIPYYHYENFLSDNYRVIDDKNYLNWLKTYSNTDYPNETKYARRWTQPANKYAYYLNEADVVIAPLENTKFNNMKSCLKQIEAWSRKLVVICSDVIPYNVDGKHMENCILIPNKPNSKKHWFKALKKVIIDKELRKELGNNLYKDFSKKYNLNIINKKRSEFYKSIITDEETI